jgi:hybrid cluster-associated redox disulfide protein
MITGEITITELKQKYPELINFLVEEYGFYCFNCWLGQFETLEEGAAVHKIEGEDFIEMLVRLNQLIKVTSTSALAH